nr:TonB family protein [Acidobacteriota bacterium]
SVNVPEDSGRRGVKLYQQGDIKGAIEVLRSAVKERKDNSEAWHYLGLALNRNGDVKGARKAFETAVKLRPDFSPSHTGLAYALLLTNKLSEAGREAERALALDPKIAEAHYIVGAVRLRGKLYAKALEASEAALRIKPELSPALLVKTQAQVNIYLEAIAPVEKESRDSRVQRSREAGVHLREAVQSLEKFLALEPNVKNADIWRQQLETMQVHSGSGGSDGPIFSPSEVTTKAVIRKKVEPQYTEYARQSGIEGTVLMRAVFAADGKVKHILLVQALSHGLTEEAIKVARQIKFNPAIKDGRPVSQFVQIEYNFHLY